MNIKEELRKAFAKVKGGPTAEPKPEKPKPTGDQLREALRDYNARRHAGEVLHNLLQDYAGRHKDGSRKRIDLYLEMDGKIYNIREDTWYGLNITEREIIRE